MTDDFMRKTMLKQFAWIAAGLAMSLGVSFAMWHFMGDAAFPWNIILIIGLFMLMSYLLQRRQFKKMGMLRESRPLKIGGLFGKVKGRRKEYTCFNCATVHRQDRCPVCGARGGRMSL